MKINFILLISLILSSGCSRKSPSSPEYTADKESGIKYARGFEIMEDKELITLRVKNPWQQAENITYNYWLGKAEIPSDKSIPSNRYFKVPVQKVVCFSTTFIGFIDFLDREQSIIGISGKQYVTCPCLVDKIKRGEISDIGYDEKINYERLIELQPDVVFLYGITGAVSSTIAKLDEIGIKSVVIAEYLEETPLAKMEWVKYIASFYDLAEEAYSRFDSVEANYNRFVDLASLQKDKPSILLGLPWSGTWYISGGKSYTARLLHDAGGNYLWKGLPYRDSQPVSLEKVFEKACQADFWLNAGEAETKADILNIDERFSRVKAFRNNAIYNNNNQVNTSGGNAYFEKGVVEPDIILMDVLSILHPQLLPSYQMKYYKKLE
ncbi:MAG: ABC transporter substrate-binding protein [Bacteroidales bacterium]|nr:ABC transporter substrate-binding protein [Bacteroidales bacterium]